MLTAAEILDTASRSGVASTNSLKDELGVPRSTLRNAIKRHNIGHQLDRIYAANLRDDTATAVRRTGDTIEAAGTDVRTLDDLLEAAEVDPDVWTVRDYNVSTWDQGDTKRYSVRAKLARREPESELTALRDAVLADMREAAPPPVRRYKATPRSGLCMEVNIYDLHLGKLAHEEETGNNYDAKIAVRAFRYVLEQFLTHAQNLNVDRFVFPVGNDLLHVDGEEDATTAGTPQDTDGRYYRSRKRAVQLMREAVQAMAQIADVDVVIVAGNHARMQETMLGDVLEAYFEADDRVTIHDAPTPRKYIRHGSTLLGFTHGDGIKPAQLPLLMATEVPDMWADTFHRTWSTGHLHQRKSDKFGSVAEYNGVEVRISPSLSGSDSWHVSKGYVNNLRAAEAHVHSIDQGEIARFRATIPRDYE